MLEKYSQVGQDKFVLSLFDKDYKGTFIDIGCRLLDEINNTVMLEENGWFGLSLDIDNLSEQWTSRKSPFICHDALTCDYKELFIKYNLPKTIDYLSLDIEGNGTRFLALKKVMESGYDFKVMTIEHDAYRGYHNMERVPQRKLLTNLGYLLLCADVKIDEPFEDWWINPKYFNEIDYIHLLSSDISYIKLLEKIKIS